MENNTVNKTQKENNDELWLKEYYEFYDNEKAGNNAKNKVHNEEKEEVKKSDLHYKIQRYEILIITLFIILGFLSIYLKRHFYVVAIWLFIIFFFSWFSEKTNGSNIVNSKVSNPFYHIFYNFWFYKERWLYSKLNILNLIFIIIYSPILVSELSLLWFIFWPIFLWIWPFWFYVCRFVVEIFKFIRRAIRWEVDWNKVFNQVLTIAIIWILFRMWMKYDVFLWIGNLLQNQS